MRKRDKEIEKKDEIHSASRCHHDSRLVLEQGLDDRLRELGERDFRLVKREDLFFALRFEL